MAALGPISLITSCMHEHEANKRVTRRTYALALPAVGWVGGGQGTHLVGADGDVGAVHEGVALDEVVGGERVRGEGLAAGDDGVVCADVEAVAQAEEVVRRRCHSVRPFQGMHWRGSERTMDRGRRCRGRARALVGRTEVRISSRQALGVCSTYVCPGSRVDATGCAVWWFCIRISPRFLGNECQNSIVKCDQCQRTRQNCGAAN